MLRSLFTALFLMILCGNAYAWDGQRKGFIINGGAGLGLISAKQKTSGISARENKIAGMSDFRIGYAPNNRLAVTYAVESAIFNTTDTFNNSKTFLQQIHGVGVMYFTKPAGMPSPLITASVGLGVFDSFTSGANPHYGFGMAVGGGGEVKPHVNVHAGLMFTTTSRTVAGIDVDTQVFSFRVMLTFTGY